MNGEKADMVFTDPPYGVSYEGGHNQKKRKGYQ
jgi:DNA modification methylase